MQTSFLRKHVDGSGKGDTIRGSIWSVRERKFPGRKRVLKKKSREGREDWKGEGTNRLQEGGGKQSCFARSHEAHRAIVVIILPWGGGIWNGRSAKEGREDVGK